MKSAGGAARSPAADVPVLTTARLVLSRPQSSDVDAIQRLADDWAVAQWLARVPHPYSRDDAVFFIEQVVPAEACWAIRDLDGGALMGVVGLTNPASEPPEFGYWLGRPFWARGFATEAGRAVLDHAFGAAGLPMVLSAYFAENDRSARVLGKLGFRPIGVSQRWSVARGETLAQVNLSLTRRTWQQSRA